MATQPVFASPKAERVVAEKLAAFPKLRALAWDGTTLYLSRGYTLLALHAGHDPLTLSEVGQFRPSWRTLTCRNRFSHRLLRDGFHALAIHPSGNMIAAVPGAIATSRAGETEFRVTHRIHRGTRPLHIATAPDGRFTWGEYFDNSHRDEVHIYASDDAGMNWNIVYTFPRHSIRHVHNIVYDRWDNCFWVFTGDYGSECRIIRASLDFRTMDEVISGGQQARAVAAVPTESGLFYSSDTPLEQNYIYHLNRRRRIQKLHAISSSSIYGCRNRTGIFFSTMVEPSPVNRSRRVQIFAGSQEGEWNVLGSWQKDRWPMKFFQYGNAFLPDGYNSTDLLAACTVAVEAEDIQTTIWRTSRLNESRC